MPNNPTARRHTWGTWLATGLLIGSSTLAGVWISLYADIFRINALDPQLAHRIGYAAVWMPVVIAMVAAAFLTAWWQRPVVAEADK